jgi:hypothetical protein
MGAAMRAGRYRLRALAAVLPALLVVAPAGPAAGSGTAGGPDARSQAAAGHGREPGCTVFYGADDRVTLAGSNEDSVSPYSHVWFVPGNADDHGQVYFGFEDGIPQGGMNEAGLFFDGLALRCKPLPVPDPRPVHEGAMLRGELTDKIMAEAGTVGEALAILDTYSHRGMDTYQLLFGDAAGHSRIVDGDTILPGEDRF